MAIGWQRGTWGSGPWGTGTTITPSVGALTTASAAPIPLSGDIAAGTVGALALAGVAPTITNKLDIVPDVGSVNINGLVPDVYPKKITTLIGTLALSSSAPVVTNVVSRLVTGSATIQGVAPIISDPNWIIIDTDQTPVWKEI